MRFACVIVIAGCGHAPPPPVAEPIDRQCALPATPDVIVRDGTAALVRWDVPDDDVWWQPVIPDDAAYLAYRRAIRDAGADLARPIADETIARTDDEREIWRRERLNAELAFGGDAGRVRPVHCLDAVLFALQNARHDELTTPTEFVALVLRKDSTLRIYAGSGDEMFPPKSVYGIDQARRDVADGWKLDLHLHNHTIQKRGVRPALGTPAPSTGDVQLLRGLATDLGLARVWVTNGMFTVDIPASALPRYHARD
jgi:hypothetical protein